jgi:hypothetical protein
MKMRTSPGMLLLAIYLILIGATALFSIRMGEMGIVKPILALVAGILILMGR